MKSWKIVMLLGAIGILGLVIWPMRAEIKQLETETITRTQTQAKKTAEYRTTSIYPKKTFSSRIFV
jgi:hypothetical protein